VLLCFACGPQSGTDAIVGERCPRCIRGTSHRRTASPQSSSVFLLRPIRARTPLYVAPARHEYEYLETEPEKVSYSCEKLAVDKRYLLARLYLDRNTSRSSVRYFVDKFPMFLASRSPMVMFTYLHHGMDGFSDFVQHLETYLPLFRQLAEFRLLYVSRTDVHFDEATELFDSLVRIPLESDITDDALRYFRIRREWDDRHYGTVSDAELIYRNQAGARFKGEAFEGL
jgi:hypothetical protein